MFRLWLGTRSYDLDLASVVLNLILCRNGEIERMFYFSNVFVVFRYTKYIESDAQLVSVVQSSKIKEKWFCVKGASYSKLFKKVAVSG